MLERALGAACLLAVGQKHLVVDGPVFVVLLQEQLRLHLRLASRVVLPPLLGVLEIAVTGQFLAVDADGLLTKLSGVFFDHLLTALGHNVGLRLGSPVLLLHAEVAHLSRIQSLLCVLEFAHIVLQSLQVQ